MIFGQLGKLSCGKRANITPRLVKLVCYIRVKTWYSATPLQINEPTKYDEIQIWFLTSSDSYSKARCGIAVWICGSPAIFPVGDLGNAAVQRNADKLCVYFFTSAADCRWSQVCFHNHCLFYLSVGVLIGLICYSVNCAWSYRCATQLFKTSTYLM